MRKLTLWLIAFLFSASIASAQPVPGPGALVSEVDGTPNAFVTRIIFPNGTLTIANGAATYSGIGAAETDPVVGAINGIVQADGAGNISAVTQVLAANGGTGIDTSGSTGVPSVSFGTWSVAAQLIHEYGGLEADVSSYSGILAVLAGSTYELDTLAELNTVIGETLLDDGDIGDSTAIGLTTGDNFTNISGSASDDSLNEYLTALNTEHGRLRLPLTASEPSDETIGNIYYCDASSWDPASRGATADDYLVICTATGSPGTYKAFLDDAGSILQHHYAIDGTPDAMTDDDYNGITLEGINFGETVAQWACVFLAADGKVDIADADAAGEFPAIGIVVGGGDDTDPAIILTRGVVRNEGWTGLTVGGAVYLGDAGAGAVTQTAPSTSGDCVQLIGRALSDSEIYFNFSGHWLEVE